MKIALLAPAEHLVPPITYGGKELVIAELANGLVEAGHEVHLYAAQGSQTKATLHSIAEQTIPALLADLGESENHKLHLAYSQSVCARTVEMVRGESYDIIHNHQHWQYATLAHLFDCPLVTTWHTDLREQYARMLEEMYPHGNYVSISDSQRRARPGMHFLATAYNGIEMDIYPFNPDPQDYLAFLGRISPDKGVVQAIDTAIAASIRLKIGGYIAPAERTYFENEIRPRIDGDRIQFLGEMNHSQKVELLGGAQAVLGLVQWEEPFGMFVVEALACGTPVIATRRGAIPEILEDRRNGFIVENTIEAAVGAIKRIGEISRQECRSSVEQRFSASSMTTAYEAVYHSLTSPNR
ncbi:MAG: glycosyltransferase family 4 protein [bacterium]